MNEHEISLIIRAVDQSSRTLKQLEQVSATTARTVQRTFSRMNDALRKGFDKFFDAVRRGFRRMQTFAHNTARRIGQAFRSLSGGFGLVGGLGAAGVGGAAVNRLFERQRQEALLRATRPDRGVRSQLRAFAMNQQGRGGAFFEPQIFGGLTAGRRIQNPQDLMRLVQALRGPSLLGEGGLPMAVTAVQRAMFEGEAELAERFGLLLREQNLTDVAGEVFGKKVTQLTAAEKAQAVYIEALRQSNQLQALENELLEDGAGKYLKLKNRLDAFLLTIGQRLAPIIEGVLNFLDDPLNRLNEFFTRMSHAWANVGVRIRHEVQSIVDDIVNTFKTGINSIVEAINRIIPFERGKFPLPFDANNLGKGRGPKPSGALGFASAFRSLFAGQAGPPQGFTPQVFPPFQAIRSTAVAAPATPVSSGLSMAALLGNQLMRGQFAQGFGGLQGAFQGFSQLQATRGVQRANAFRGGGFGGLGFGAGGNQQLAQSHDIVSRKAVQTASTITQAWNTIAVHTDNMAVNVISSIGHLVNNVMQMLNQANQMGGLAGGLLGGLGIPFLAIGTGVSIAAQASANKERERKRLNRPGNTRRIALGAS